MYVLGVVEHPNLVKLVGYCAEDDETGIQRLLVYELMPNRSLEYYLSMSSDTPLTWTTRLNVAEDIARGLAHLHERMIMLKGFKSSDIYLDDQWNAKILYVGLTRSEYVDELMDITTRMEEVGLYMASEYFQRGHNTSKIDVWSYGVFLYELITGRPPLDMNGPQNKHKILEWVKPFMGSKRFQLTVDPRLEGNYSLKLAQKLLVISSKCLSKNPKSRPEMSEVLQMVNKLIAVPSQATNHATPFMSLAHAAAFKIKKVFISATKNESNHGVLKYVGDMQIRESACLPHMCPWKLFKSCSKKEY